MPVEQLNVLKYRVVSNVKLFQLIFWFFEQSCIEFGEDYFRSSNNDKHTTIWVIHAFQISQTYL